MNAKKISPIILKGTRDFLPSEVIQRKKIMDIIQKMFEKFGYVPVETPILCPAETILGKYGEEGEKLTYNFKDAGGRGIALPYDLTVPFARYFAANYNNLEVPFKRYQIQRVWRAEKPQKGRLREFYQCDIDIIGSKSLICEAEIAKIIVSTLLELGIDDFKIKINSRRLINAILKSFGIPDSKVTPMIRIIDKKDKIGEEQMVQELSNIGVENGLEVLSRLKPMNSNKETMDKLRDSDVSELETFMRYASDLGVDDKWIQFDPMMARGLDYYTGVIYEVVSENSSLGAICAGGRYDDLCSMFCDQNFSGVGVAFGFERIMMLLKERMLVVENKSCSNVLVTVFDESALKKSLSAYNSLVEAGINSEIYLGLDKLNKQFKYADKKKIPFVVIQGPEEILAKTVTVKRMDTGKQKTIPDSQLVEYIKGYYEAN
ncbi:MAG: hypothetical protein ACD_51C00028G0018 [uncultured bacterium]|nr:MAG: hypothetical protein ACD_51C00028G0018 [uncultured bacterium]OGJ47882.1 MAG: histidine--tRNA ligase [Candidatus Peregrinibacteria bacterium RIFOXYA2_FULL_41_18]OGJ49139.1 MAG: histidine--tRNA ligase [Candidatus Peregrinibacteria bacterium RIFOXYB12_FULL_41_12]OGJ52790.1 MAG: histidine--tRNA ligase [Candidatus Peregrinibacteria bacterium RIFOXYB2_FULL_41_88]OGJ53305.1 MAG: histidine--tRNA ligase [Candidatus Peregrinibacteria bacterium RIFOXYC2_FULL_41_22]